SDVEAVADPRQRDRDHRRVERGEDRPERDGYEHRPLGASLGRDQAQSGSRRTVPASPSTSTSCPSRIAAVAIFVPTTAGSPYSRATTAQWLSRPPASVTIAAARAKSGV